MTLPNGNLLLLLDHKTAEEAAAGGNPAFIHPEGLHSDAIVEVRPIYPDRAAIVRERSVM